MASPFSYDLACIWFHSFLKMTKSPLSLCTTFLHTCSSEYVSQRLPTWLLWLVQPLHWCDIARHCQGEFAFHPFWEYLQGRITGSCSNSNFLEKLPACIPQWLTLNSLTAVYKGCQLLDILGNSCYFPLVSIPGMPVGTSWYFFVALVCLSLMTGGGWSIFLYSITIFFRKPVCLRSLLYVPIRILLLLSSRSSLCILDISTLRNRRLAGAFHSVCLSFHLDFGFWNRVLQCSSGPLHRLGRPHTMTCFHHTHLTFSLLLVPSGVQKCC